MEQVKAGTTREAILMLLKTQGSMTVNEISQALGITPMGVRQHLNQLEGEGYLSSFQRRGKVGRPGYVYSLTEAANELFPAAYENFATSLLEALESLGGEEAVRALFLKRSQHLADSFLKKHADKPLKERVRLLAELQDEAGFLAEVEEDGNALRLRENHCAISTVASRFPHACQAELATFRSVFEEARVSRTRCISAGDRACEYIIQPVSPAEQESAE